MANLLLATASVILVTIAVAAAVVLALVVLTNFMRNNITASGAMRGDLQAQSAESLTVSYLLVLMCAQEKSKITYERNVITKLRMVKLPLPYLTHNFEPVYIAIKCHQDNVNSVDSNQTPRPYLLL